MWWVKDGMSPLVLQYVTLQVMVKPFVIRPAVQAHYYEVSSLADQYAHVMVFTLGDHSATVNRSVSMLAEVRACSHSCTSCDSTACSVMMPSGAEWFAWTCQTASRTSQQLLLQILTLQGMVCSCAVQLAPELQDHPASTCTACPTLSATLAAATQAPGCVVHDQEPVWLDVGLHAVWHLCVPHAQGGP